MSLAITIEDLRSKAPYQNYLKVQRNVLEALPRASGAMSTPSNYWHEELAGFDYMLDASPLIIEKLREHCYHITGIKSYEYRRHHAHAVKPFAQKLAKLKELDGGKLFVPENPALGGFGHEIDGALVNIDTLKFYESLIALDRAGLLDGLCGNPEAKQVWLEIGAGWGGFAYVAKTLFPQLTYVIVDLPQTMLFSATYLMSMFPEARCAIYPENSVEDITGNIRDYDFVFLPHFLFPDLKLPVDLAINMVSFQEMTTEQVTGYVRHLAEMECMTLYSHNRDRSGHNTELTAVSDIIATDFASPREIELLGYSYTSLTPPGERDMTKPKTKSKGDWLRLLKAEASKVKPIKKLTRKATDYRHLVARRPGP